MCRLPRDNLKVKHIAQLHDDTTEHIYTDQVLYLSMCRSYYMFLLTLFLFCM